MMSSDSINAFDKQRNRGWQAGKTKTRQVRSHGMICFLHRVSREYVVYGYYTCPLSVPCWKTGGVCNCPTKAPIFSPAELPTTLLSRGSNRMKSIRCAERGKRASQDLGSARLSVPATQLPRIFERYLQRYLYITSIFTKSNFQDTLNTHPIPPITDVLIESEAIS